MKLKQSDKAYELIRADIVSCALKPGQEVAQTELAHRYGLGVTPIREALLRLEHAGYVQAYPRLGYIVSPVTVADVHELSELRAIVEAATVRLAAERASEDQLAQLLADADFTYIYGDKRSYAEFLKRNSALHVSVAAASGNARLTDLVRRLFDDLTRLLQLGLELGDRSVAVRDEHMALARALSKRDGDLAERIILTQIERSRQRLVNALAGQRETSGVNGSNIEIQVRPYDSGLTA